MLNMLNWISISIHGNDLSNQYPLGWVESTGTFSNIVFRPLLEQTILHHSVSVHSGCSTFQVLYRLTGFGLNSIEGKGFLLPPAWKKPAVPNRERFYEKCSVGSTESLLDSHENSSTSGKNSLIENLRAQLPFYSGSKLQKRRMMRNVSFLAQLHEKPIIEMGLKIRATLVAIVVAPFATSARIILSSFAASIDFQILFLI